MITRRNTIASLFALPAAVAYLPARARSRARVGLSLPLTGVQGGVASEMLTGYQLAMTAMKAEGADVELLVEDDASVADKTSAAIRKFGLDSSIVAVSGIVGTPHAKLAIPVARAAGVPVVGLRSGAGELRDGLPGVFHLRASYEAEIDKMVAMLRASVSRIGVVYSQDSFGTAAYGHLLKVATAAGIVVAQALAADRNGADVEKVTRAVTDEKHHIGALIILMIARPTVTALRTARSQSFYGPTFAMSFTAGKDLADAGGALVGGLGLVSAFNLPRSGVDETSRSFRAGLTSIAKPELVNSVTAFEGYTYGLALGRAIARCGDRLTRESLVHALATPPGIAVCGQSLQFDSQLCGRHYLQVLVFDRTGVLRA
jgi:ABC-type branched-subunit amino acid transport system substrate-binding protein